MGLPEPVQLEHSFELSPGTALQPYRHQQGLRVCPGVRSSSLKSTQAVASS